MLSILKIIWKKKSTFTYKNIIFLGEFLWLLLISIQSLDVKKEEWT